jgi:hypothetical protein
MKYLLLILAALLVLFPVQVFASSPLTGLHIFDPNEHMVLIIVFDTSMMDSAPWTQQHILARQAMSMLKPGDELVFIIARPSSPRLEMRCVIEAGNTDQQNQFNQILGSLHQAFLARADLAEATQLAYRELLMRPKGPKSCLVLSDGKHSQGQINKIRDVAALFKKQGWQFCVTAAGDANRQLFMAGSQGELRVEMLDGANIAGWFESTRPDKVEVSKSPTAVQPAQQAQQPIINIILPERPVTPVEDKSSAAPPSPSTSGPTEKTHPGKTSKPEIINTEPVKQMLPTSVVDGIPAIGTHKDSMPLSTSRVPEINHITPKPVPQVSATKANHPASDRSWLKRSCNWVRKHATVILSLATACVLVPLVLLVLKINWGGMNKKNTASDSVDDSEAKPHCIVAMMGDNRFTLGDESSIPMLIFGSGPESAISMEAEGILPKEFTLKRTRRGFSIRNHSPEILTVNGLPVRQHRSVDITLPATIQSPDRFYISVTREPAQIQPEQAEGEK